MRGAVSAGMAHGRGDTVSVSDELRTLLFSKEFGLEPWRVWAEVPADELDFWIELYAQYTSGYNAEKKTQRKRPPRG